MEDDSVSIQCENRLLCGKKINKSDIIYSIPLDENYDEAEGMFCSIKCAVYTNLNTISMKRRPNDKMFRHTWMMNTAKNNKKKVLINKKKTLL